MDALLLTVPETARLLSVSRQTVYKMVGSGDLQSVQVRSVMRIPRTSVDRYIAAQASGTDR